MTAKTIARLAAALLLAAPLALAADQGGSEATVDPKAAAIADEVLQALGGREAWDATRFIRFSFAGRRTHHWDKHTGRHRLEGETQQGEKYVVLQDLDTKEGQVWLNGQPAPPERTKDLLERAYGAWINDTYWLLMPYKLRDPGVNLAYAGEETIDGVTYDKLLLSFNKVGLTPGDRYWAYINRNTKLMDRWAFHLESMAPDAEPVAWKWDGWTRHGRIMLAPGRQQLTGESRSLPLDDIQVSDSLPDAVFTSPDPVAK